MIVFPYFQVDNIGGLSVGSGAFMAPSLGGSNLGGNVPATGSGPGAIGAVPSSQYAQNLAALAPGRPTSSPVKNLFGGQASGQGVGPAFNQVQSLSSQLQGPSLASQLQG